MGKSQPEAPKAPDPQVTASAQTKTNIGTEIANNSMRHVNQRTPWGSLTYNQTGTTNYTDPHDGTVHELPQYTATQTLSPEQQRILDAQNRAKGSLANFAADQTMRLGGLLRQPLNTDGLPAARAVPQSAPALRTDFDSGGPITRSYGTDFGDQRDRVEAALLQRLSTSLDKDRSGLEARLADQGIALGSQAYASAMDTHGRARNDARAAAIINAGQEHSRLANLERGRAVFENAAQEQQFGQNARRAGFTNMALQQRFNMNKALRAEQAAERARALQERMALRSQPVNELAALVGRSQVRNPSFVNQQSAQMPTVDYAGLVNQDYKNRYAAYQQDVAQQNDMMGGILGAAAGLFGKIALSDRRAKKDIKRVGKTDDNQPIYSFRYKAGGPIQLGLMAQDVEKKKPEAVKTIGGVKMVDYGIALGKRA